MDRIWVTLFVGLFFLGGVLIIQQTFEPKIEDPRPRPIQGICAVVSFPQPHSQRLQDTISLCVNERGWSLLKRYNLNLEPHMEAIQEKIDSLRTTAIERGFYELEFDQQLELLIFPNE